MSIDVYEIDKNVSSLINALKIILPGEKAGSYIWNDDDRNRELVPKIMAHLFALNTLLKSRTILKDQKEDKQNIKIECQLYQMPHAGQVVAIFRMLGIGCKTCNEDTLRNHMVELPPGEGKTVVCGITMAVLALLKHDCYCACTTTYLANRNKLEFADLFELLPGFAAQRITYDTLENIFAKKIDYTGKLQDHVYSVIKGNFVEMEKKSELPSVLLLDDLEMLLDETIYGNIYCPKLLLKD